MFDRSSTVSGDSKLGVPRLTAELRTQAAKNMSRTLGGVSLTRTNPVWTKRINFSYQSDMVQETHRDYSKHD